MKRLLPSIWLSLAFLAAPCFAANPPFYPRDTKSNQDLGGINQNFQDQANQGQNRETKTVVPVNCPSGWYPSNVVIANGRATGGQCTQLVDPATNNATFVSSVTASQLTVSGNTVLGSSVTASYLSGTWHIVASTSPQGVAASTFTSLTAGTFYACVFDLAWNTSAGILRGRFNGDTGANYRRGSWGYTDTGGSGVAGSATDTSFSIGDAVTAVNVGDMVHGQFTFVANPNTLTKAGVNGSVMFISLTPNMTGVSFSGHYSGSSNVTQMSFIATAGTYTGKIYLLALQP